MKIKSTLLLVMACALWACSDDPAIDEIISQPDTPTGDNYADRDVAKTYSSGGAVSSLGHSVEYRFDLDAAGTHRYTRWLAADSVSASWPDPGAYSVKAQARCASHTDKMSGWSDGLAVGVAVEIVTGPARPVGPTHAWPGVEAVYCTGNAGSNLDHSIEYQFDFNAAGSPDTSTWNTASCVTKIWPDVGTHVIKARARCAVHQNIISPWSEGKPVTVSPVQYRPGTGFAVRFDDVWSPYNWAQIPKDTVGMYKPFAIAYHGVTPHPPIVAYRFFPLTPSIVLPGAYQWTTDTADTLRSFSNYGYEVIPAGIFRLAAQCRDNALAESPVDSINYTEGVCNLVVNFDPDTRINAVINTYWAGGTTHEREIDFTDGLPDTVPYKSWVKLFYSGRDDQRDGKLCSPADLDLCIDFQFRYFMRREADGFIFTENSYWLPRHGTHDTDMFSANDSNSVNVGSLDYDFFTRAIDETGRPDGTPPSISIVGNYAPTLDSVVVEDHLGDRLDLSVVDTLTWNFWKGEGWPYTCFCDTLDLGPFGSCPDHDCPPGTGSLDYFKTFSFSLKAWGHDHPLELPGSGVKAWQYQIYDSGNNLLSLGSSGGGWFNTDDMNELDEVIRIRFQYPGPAAPNPDPLGNTVFDNLPSWFDQDLTLIVWGRDTLAQGQEGDFRQIVYLNGHQVIVNEFAAGGPGRYTEKKTFTFHLRMVRP